MRRNVYEQCPIFKNDFITLKKTTTIEAEELLKCYSDKEAVKFFNSDNCHGDDFYYTTVERMEQAIKFWDFSYENKYFVRWTIVLNDTNEKVGTIEMFRREAEDEFNHYGVLRIDLQSKYEKQKYIDDILEIVNENFFELFNVEQILIKAIPNATERIESLKKKSYVPLNRKMMTYDDYFIRTKA
ncbi:GNAT family N-acetyltransferase [Clostridium sp.]|uniref:GNAT family N-acetyltransferase n=1 Tax=Clostridium sp. TaxID=1506 RepID=UPI003216A10D